MMPHNAARLSRPHLRARCVRIPTYDPWICSELCADRRDVLRNRAVRHNQLRAEAQEEQLHNGIKVALAVRAARKKACIDTYRYQVKPSRFPNLYTSCIEARRFPSIWRNSFV